jgi:CheY-like chemotaxis protein
MLETMLRSIIMTDDDKDDCEMTRLALEENKIANPFLTFPNGEELLNYLNRKDYTPPCFILLDLNMPKMNGREALRRIKESEKLRRIPVVILTTSKSDEDIWNSYGLGANSYITKPVKFERLVEIVKSIRNYWLGIVELPPDIET